MNSRRDPVLNYVQTFLDSQLRKTGGMTKRKGERKGREGGEVPIKSESCWQERRGKQLRGF